MLQRRTTNNNTNNKEGCYKRRTEKIPTIKNATKEGRRRLARPREVTRVQAPRGAPHAEPVVDQQQLDARGARIGEEVTVVRRGQRRWSAQRSSSSRSSAGAACPSVRCTARVDRCGSLEQARGQFAQPGRAVVGG